MQIFLAHASEDKPQVMALYDKLKSAEYQLWLDKKILIPGQNWHNEIRKAIKNSDILKVTIHLLKLIFRLLNIFWKFKK